MDTSSAPTTTNGSSTSVKWYKRRRNQVILGVSILVLIAAIVLIVEYVPTGASISSSLLSSSSRSLSFLSLTSVGQALDNSSQLVSLQYFVLEIMICKGLTVSGTAYSSPSGCIQLYKTSSSASYSTYGITEATADTTNYVNLLNPSQTSMLSNSAPLSNSMAGSYQWGIITWMRPVKVFATIPMSDGSTFYTHPIDTTTGKTSKLLNESSAEESIVLLGNGGNWFRFQNPFVISTRDISGRSQFKLKLAFNPDGIIQASQQVSNYPLSDSEMNGINVPLLDLAPVAYKSGDKVKRETYYISFSNPSYASAGVSRLELYYLNSDPTRTIYAATISAFYTSSTANVTLPMQMKISFITTNSDNSVNFLDWQYSPLIARMARLVAAGASGNCMYKDDSFSNLNSTTYTLHALDTVAS